MASPAPPTADGTEPAPDHVQARMPKRRMIIAGLVVGVVASAVTAAAVIADRPKPACACSIEPDLRGPALDAATRFDTLVRQADISAAWALLTDQAHARYTDEAGFRPTFDRLRKTAHEAARKTEAAREPEAARTSEAANASGAGWQAVSERARYDRPSEVVLVRAARTMLVLMRLGQAGSERIDPEPPTLKLTAHVEDGGVRVGLPDADLDRVSFVTIDSLGRTARPAREPLSEDAVRLTGSRPLHPPITVIAIEDSTDGPRLEAVAVPG
ncbi:hypothetical protein KOI35_16260 [Actinoplanes bogorensis]|uniref:Secreted protein n=1 Tax=Paractinoplanes bogorensis TaxID=1610840 RepID=A0ABS5YQR4_9ACTN|nr:hypothetical protein [Actinoplanes bogorensis]MBU2665058.1 hypothetical protein [Actinoplanes bogorensis]